MTDMERIQELIAEATIDCYGEEEEYWSMWTSLEDNLDFPLPAKLIGQTVQVIGLDSEASTDRRGIVANIRYKNRIYSINLADLKIVDTDSDSADWLAAYRYWLR